jgi:hypothetical protein
MCNICLVVPGLFHLTWDPSVQSLLLQMNYLCVLLGI